MKSILLSICILSLSTWTVAQVLPGTSWDVQADGQPSFLVSFSNDSLTIGEGAFQIENAAYYTESGNLFTIVDSQDLEGGCGMVEGSYTFVIAGDVLTFTMVDDACSDRAMTFIDSVWTAAVMNMDESEIVEATFSVYPNPTTQDINVSVSSALDGESYVIYSAIGQQVAKGTLSVMGNRIEMEHLPSGVYFIKTNLSKSAQRFIKE